MTIKSLYLENFRAYKNVKVLFDENMNVIIGQNDIGKSTILEALDIFFGQDTIKIDISDWNKERVSNKIVISVEFLVDNDLEIIIDSANPTNLNDEFLLNSSGHLNIYKEYEISSEKLSKEKIYLNVNYPNNYDTPLVNMKIATLKQRLLSIKDDIDNYDEIDKTRSADIRKALYSFDVTAESTFDNKIIDLQKDDAKSIWESLQKELPLYFLFQSDRANKDSDSDIQNPLKSATKRIVSNFETEFETIKNNLETQLNQIGIDTISKMKDMGLNVADSLTPKVTNKSLDTLFSFSLESDDGIALNKRGSGFRRMVMLNYFRAEAERQIASKTNKYVIYAIEEPETAQHPNHQKMLVEALLELSFKEKHQIIITTHTPEIAKMVDESSLLLVNKDADDNPFIVENVEDKIKLIAETLGVLPNINIENIQKIKVVVCFEGYTDIEFMKNINTNIDEYSEIIDLNDESVLLVFLGGSTLQHYINYNYLEKLNVPQIHIYDSDFNQNDTKLHFQYQKYIDKINGQANSNFGFMTNKAEIENYIHPEIIKSCYEIDTCFHKEDEDWLLNWSGNDLPSYINQHADKHNPRIEPISSKRMSKKHLSTELSKSLTKEHLVELEAFDEIKSWFEKIAELQS